MIKINLDKISPLYPRAVLRSGAILVVKIIWKDESTWQTNTSLAFQTAYSRG